MGETDRQMMSKEEDSSSEDEFSKNALQEAIDHEFVKDDYFSKKTSIVVTNSDRNNGTHADNNDEIKSEKVKSLRRKPEEQKFDNFGVSATFQKFVAKKLDEILEKSIELEDEQADIASQKSRTIENGSENGSVRLLNSCADFLSTAEEPIIVKRRKRSRKEEKIEEKNNLIKCKEVAVSPDWILSKEATKAWSTKRKGLEFKYKRLKNGTLMEIEPDKFHSPS